MTTEEKIIIDRLGELNVPYSIYRHDAKFTLEEKAELDRELNIRAKHCKNILLTDRKKSCFFLLVMPFEKTFRTAEVSKELGTSRLSFASEEILWGRLKCRSGCLGSLSLIFDEECEIGLAIDRELLEYDELCFHPNIDTTTVTIKTDVFLNDFLPKIKHMPKFVTVTYNNQG